MTKQELSAALSASIAKVRAKYPTLYTRPTTTYAAPPPPTTSAPFGFPSAPVSSPIPTLYPAPTPTPTPTPSPTPTTTVPVTCATNWPALTDEINRISEAVRSCSSPATTTLPADPGACPAGSVQTGSRDAYLAARAAFASAKEDAAIFCAEAPEDPVTTTTPATSSSQQTVYSQQRRQPAEEEDDGLIEPPPGMSRNAKVGIGIGGLLLVGGIAWWMLRRRAKRRH